MRKRANHSAHGKYRNVNEKEDIRNRPILVNSLVTHKMQMNNEIRRELKPLKN